MLKKKPQLYAKWLLWLNIAERQGFEPWQRLLVDSLAGCCITTLPPLRINMQN